MTDRIPRLAIRLTAAERDTLTAAARRSGLGIGPWLRALGLWRARELANLASHGIRPAPRKRRTKP